MSQTLADAIQLATVALPAMFVVIILFIGCTTALTKLFPYKEEADD